MHMLVILYQKSIKQCPFNCLGPIFGCSALHVGAFFKCKFCKSFCSTCRCKSLEVNSNAIQVQFNQFSIFVVVVAAYITSKGYDFVFSFSPVCNFLLTSALHFRSQPITKMLLLFSLLIPILYSCHQPLPFYISRSYLVYLTFPKIFYFLTHISSSIFQVCLMQGTKFSLQLKYSWS